MTRSKVKAQERVESLAMGRLTLELREVLAARSRLPRSFKSTGVEISSRYSTAFADAFKKDSATMVG